MDYTDIPSGLIEVLMFMTSLGLTYFVFFVLSVRRSGYIFPVFLAITIRAMASLVNRYVFVLPHGGSDAVTFERRAWEWSQSGCGNLGEHLNLGASYVHSWVVGNVYACTSRSPLFFQSINIFFGVATVYLIARTAEKLWDRQAAIRAAWVSAFFPMLIINSSVPLREAWFTFFLMMGLFLIVDWMQRGRLFQLVFSIAFLFAASVIHGGAFFAFIAMALVVMAWSCGDIAKGLSTGRAKLPLLIGALFLVLACSVGFIALSELRFSSIGDVTQLFDQLDGLDERTASSARDGAAYPSYLIPGGNLDALLLTMPRMIYLLIAPLPWDIRSASHMVGLIDGLFYALVCLLLWRFRSVWWHEKEFVMIFCIAVSLILIYGWGTSNFGTGMRHRAKIVGVLIVLGAGLLGRRNWRNARLKKISSRVY